jgi:Cu(I)/Ag(I) efflux system membrane protein CusA/SilA
MIAQLIRWSVANRFLVLLAAFLLAMWGVYAVNNTALDAIPDLSDVQVIVKTTYAGRSPRVVEDQITYPLATTLMSVPGAKTVRGYSFFGDSYIYVLFEDGTDLYWARSRVLEYLNQAASRLPAGARPEIGPDATGVGWIYEYALVDRGKRHDLAQLTSLQNWFLKYELRGVPGVAEVATVGGMVRQYQISPDPDRLRAYGITLGTLSEAVRRANSETGGATLELGEAEYMLRATGYLKSVEDIERIPVKLGATPVLLRDVARVQIGPQMRRGIAELDGEGETVGGVIVMRSGRNALETIRAVKTKLATLKAGLPPGVEIVPVYDRSGLIERAVDTLKHRLLEEMAVVVLVCLLFLFHLRSALVALVALPLGVLAAFAIMRMQGVNANLMSLGGIAIAIGAMLDAAVVMIENAHKHLEAWRARNAGRAPSIAENFAIMETAATEVGPALFFSLLVITVSFLPVFALEAQEGRLFAPLAYTKTYAMAAAAGLSVTLVPVLMGWFIRGHIADENRNPLNRWLIALYRPLIAAVLRFPWATLALAVLILAAAWLPFSRLGSEFMPPLNEGDLLYMPTALPGISAGKAAELLQRTDALIKQVPEVKSVFGKSGRAETATDPAPLEMFETTVQLRPQAEWRPGMTLPRLIEELDNTVKLPGLSNVWVQPIRNRIDMLATGIKSPLGIKISGPDIRVIEKVGAEIERVVKDVSGTTSVFSERLSGGRYLTVRIDRTAAARFGLSQSEVQDTISGAIGGENVTETVEGLERYPVNIRFPRELRDTPEKLRQLPLLAENGNVVALGSVAEIAIEDGAPMLKSENARPSGWVFVDERGRDLGSYVAEVQQVVREKVSLPPGYSLGWSGQYEYLERAAKRMQLVVPVTLILIFLLLYFTFRQAIPALIIMGTLPFALAGGFWLVWLLGFNLSVAVAVGFIALAGVAAEFGVVMLIYLDQALARWQAEGRLNTINDLRQAIIEGAVLRVRPKAMTVAVILAGLLPIMLGGGTGSEVMQRIAAPMVGGMLTAPLLSMFVIPVAYYFWKKRTICRLP